MSFIHEIAFRTSPGVTEPAPPWFDAELVLALRNLADLSALDLYRPVGGTHDPYNKDEGPPLLIALTDFRSRAAPDAATPTSVPPPAWRPRGRRGIKIRSPRSTTAGP